MKKTTPKPLEKNQLMFSQGRFITDFKGKKQVKCMCF